jgi:L-iditol 2-dehydrogenase
LKALVFFDIEDIRLIEVPIPPINSREVLIKIHSAAICATDLRVKSSGHRTIPMGQTRILGHEMAGEIAAVGSGIKQMKVGDRVSVAPVAGCGYCRQCISGNATLCQQSSILGLDINGGFAEFMKVPESHINGGNIFQLPDSISYCEAAIAEPLATVFTGIQACDVKPSDIVLIIGAGPIGLMHIIMAKIFGAQKIIVSEISKERRKNALKYGADHAIDPLNEDLPDSVKALSYGRGADAIIVAAASPEAQVQSVNSIAIGGYINFFGTLPKEKENITINSNLLHYKNAKMFGTSGSTVLNYYRTMELLITGRLNISSLISARFPIDAFEEAFQIAKKPDSLKVIFEI